MMRFEGARRRMRLLAGAGLLALMFAGAASAQTSSDPLVDLLVKKGVLTPEDAAKIPAQPNSPERDALVRLLVAKGVLSQDDLANLAPAATRIEELPGAAPPNTTPVYAHNDHPTTLSVGPVDFTLSGFIDNDTIYRTRNEGTLGTNFFNIPFSNVEQGHIGEVRDTLQNTRLALNTTTSFDAMGQPVKASAYVEGDFLGNDAVNVDVTSNSHTLRLRLAFVDIGRADWEVLAGQAWSWLTPNRQGLGSYPSDVMVTNVYDFNYQVGLTWARQPAFRVIYHPDPNWALGVSFENPEQFGGQGEITFPAAFNATLANEIDSGTISSTPNLFPDIIPKVAYDSDVGGHKLHLEAAGLVSFFQITDLPLNGAGTFVHHDAVGYGGQLSGNLELVPGLTLLGEGFASSGGGRYIFGMAPDLVVLPTPDGKDVFISPVKSFSALAGLEWRQPKWVISGYWGAMYADRDFALDTTSTAPTLPFIGFGGPNSASTNNKLIDESSLVATYNIWTDPRYGLLQTGLQYSYIEREPWFVSKGAPANASLHMLMWDFRYVLP